MHSVVVEGITNGIADTDTDVNESTTKNGRGGKFGVGWLRGQEDCQYDGTEMRCAFIVWRWLARLALAMLNVGLAVGLDNFRVRSNGSTPYEL